MSLLGIWPRVIVMTILGYGIYELIPMKYILLAVLCALPVAAVVLVVNAVKKKKAAQSGGEVRSDPE